MDLIRILDKISNCVRKESEISKTTNTWIGEGSKFTETY